MFREDGFCDDGAHSAWSNEFQDGGTEMNRKDKQIAHV
jgi:hypothetical protein